MQKWCSKIYQVGLCLSFSVMLLTHSLDARQYAAIIIDAKTGDVIHQSNPDTPAPPASMTKMMTLYLVFKALDAGKIKFTDSIKVSKHASIQPPCKLGLRPGGKLTIKQAVLGAITKSANDATAALAEALAGSEPKFAELMTKEARRLGLQRTVFRNSSGLPDKKQTTTARDMAILGQALYRDFPHYFKLFKIQNFKYNGVNHANHNHLLERVPEIDGIKTGFINASGFNLTASMVKHGKRLIAVVMGGKTARSRDDHMLSLLNTAFDKIVKMGGKSKSGPQNLDQLLTSLSQEEVIATQEAVQDADFETLDQLLAHMDEEQASGFILAKSTPQKHASLKPLGTAPKKKVIKVSTSKPKKKPTQKMVSTKTKSKKVVVHKSKPKLAKAKSKNKIAKSKKKSV